MANSGVPAYGRRLVPQVLDELARSDPDRVYAAIPKTADVKEGYRDITVAELARCVDYTSKWLEEKFGRSENYETITYVGLSDLRGITTLLAAIKVGYKLLIPSPRNPPSVNLHLMKSTGSIKVLHAAELAPLVQPLQALDPSINTHGVPSLQEMLDSKPEKYPYEKTFDEARNDPIAVLHSSGSTGLPKPITITHGSVGAHDNDHNLSAPPGREKMDTTVFTLNGENRRLYLVLPFFHLGGFVFFVDHAILNNLTLVLGPPQAPPDASLLEDIAQQQELRAIMVVPAILEQLLHKPNGEDLLKRLDFVACAGAPLPGPVGDRVAAIVKLRIFIGSTETFPLPELAKTPEDWQYHEFSPLLKHEMQPYDDKTGTFELVIIAEEANQDATPVYHNMPGVNPFYTKDLFTQHPTKPNLYKYYGRRDDILVLANGEKVNPIPLEQHVQGSQSLAGVLLVGNGRVQTALVVEPRNALDEPPAAQAQLLETLWPRIEEANAAHVSGQGRVSQAMVICASPDKPFIRTGKGTIVRKLTEEAYKDELEHIYSRSSRQEKVVSIGLKATTKTTYQPVAIIDFLRQVLSVSFPPASTFGKEEDFFAYGLDSVQTLEIVATLKRNLEGLSSNSVDWISPRTIFQHSTLTSLSALLAAFLNDGSLPPSYDSHTARASAVRDAVAQYTRDLPARAGSRTPAASGDGEKLVVALVGSTGYVGSHLVSALLKNPNISTIYCLDRSADAPARQMSALRKLDGDLEALASKLVYLRIELGAPRLGLSTEHYQQVAKEAHVVVYNAWRLDFGLSIRSYEPFLRATRDLIELSAVSQRNMRIVFVSSISAVEGLALTGSIVPEAPVEDPLAAMNTGYGQSKLAAEQILAAAQNHSQIPVSIVRIGQIGGSSQGDSPPWADQVWISAIIRTAKALRCFPNPVAPIDWVPVDHVAAILQSIIVQLPTQGSKPLEVFNVASKPQPWSELVEVLRESHSFIGWETVPLPDWVKKLRQLSVKTGAKDVAEYPALRLLDFYESLGGGTDSLRYASEYTEAISGLDLAPVKRELLVSWFKSWNL